MGDDRNHFVLILVLIIGFAAGPFVTDMIPVVQDFPVWGKMLVWLLFPLAIMIATMPLLALLVLLRRGRTKPEPTPAPEKP